MFAGQTKHNPVLKIFELKQGCYSVDLSKKESSLCFSTAKQGFFVYQYSKQ
jgi:hypothetical protein